MVAEFPLKSNYDIVILGGGLAGLSLALHLVHSPLCGASVLIVERSPASLHQRSWSYWTDRPTLYDPIVLRAWDHVQIADVEQTRCLTEPGLRFEFIRGSDLAAFARHELGLHTNISFIQGQPQQVTDGRDGAHVSVAGQAIRAKWVFDGTGWPDTVQPRWRMYFSTWMAEVHHTTFDQTLLTFLDTRTPQAGGLRFFYRLPFSDRQALVQYVSYGHTVPSQAEARHAVQTYLAQTLGLPVIQLHPVERGCLPIIPTTPRRRLSPHCLAIGARAGLVKPTTGYGFRRIQQDSEAIVGTLSATGQLGGMPLISRRHRLYDRLLLEVLAHQGEAMAPIFAALFARNPFARVLRFLDETTTLAEDLSLIATLPARPFISALPRLATAIG